MAEKKRDKSGSQLIEELKLASFMEEGTLNSAFSKQSLDASASRQLYKHVLSFNMSTTSDLIDSWIIGFNLKVLIETKVHLNESIVSQNA